MRSRRALYPVPLHPPRLFVLFPAEYFLCRAAKPLPVPSDVKNDADGQEICDIDMNVLVDDLSGAVGEDMEIHEGARHKADEHADSQAKNQIIIFFHCYCLPMQIAPSREGISSSF